MRRWCLSLLLAATVLSPAVARQREVGEGIGLSRTDMVRTHVELAGARVDLYTPPGVDAAALIADLDLANAASADALSASVDGKRRARYPGEEIVLAVAPAATRETPGKKGTSLVQAVYWWNNEVCSTCYWFAQYTSSVAVLFVDAVDYGQFDVYDRIGSADWVYRNYVAEGEAFTRTSYGGKATTRGFRGDAADVPTQGDVVMYFFK